MPDHTKATNRISRYDLAAFLLLAGLAAFYISDAFKSIQLCDESFFLTIPHRLLLGDRLITDEWHVSQFSSVFQVLPFRIFYSLTGGTDGIVLFFRFLFIAAHIFLCSFVYLRIREYKAYALAALFFFGAFVPVNMMTVDYYTLAVFFAELLCVLLFCSKKEPSPVKLIFCGVLTAGMVLSDPLTALIYFAYTAFAAVCFVVEKKRHKTLSGEFGCLLNLRSWCFITVGVVISAAAFFAFLLSRSDLSTILRSVPNLFTDSEYQGINFAKKARQALCAYRIPEAAAAGLLLLYAARTRKTKKNGVPVTAAACALSLIVSVCMVFDADASSFSYYAFYFQRLIPIIFTALVCVIVNTELPKKPIAFFFFGMAVSLARDLSSDISFGFSTSVAIVPAVILIGLTFEKYYSGLFVTKKQTIKKSVKNMLTSKLLPKTGKICVSAMSVCLAALLLFQLGSFALLSGKYHLKEDIFFEQNNEPMDTALLRGPMKGIKTTSHAADFYNSLLDDMDAIRSGTDGAVYIMGIDPWLYLYLDGDYSTYSAWFVTSDYSTRQPEWWRQHLDRLPVCIYIPIYDQDRLIPVKETADKKLEYIKSICEGNITESKTGYTVFVDEWHLPEA